ncbi:MAG: c-type cytochrome [Steroidobacteraceae bacterium]
MIARRASTRLTINLLVASLVCATAGIAWSWQHEHTIRSRLLTIVPDKIPLDGELYRQAIARGRPAFARHCASCHSEDGRPDTVRGVPDLRDHDWLYGSGRIDEIERVVLYGIRAGNSKGKNLASMPAFATPNPYRLYRIEPLTPQEIDDVTEYLYSLQHRNNADPARVARGKQVFEGQSRGLCWDCHGGHAEGDASIGAPRLDDPIWLYGQGSRDTIRRSISYGRDGRCPAWIGKLEPATIVALAVYTQSLSKGAATDLP